MLSKSVGPIFYLASIALTAIWVVGVFFGVGYLCLSHHVQKEASRPSADSIALNASLIDSGWVYQALTRLDRLFPNTPEDALRSPDQGRAELTANAAEREREIVGVAALAKERPALESQEPVANHAIISRPTGEPSATSSAASQSFKAAEPRPPTQSRPFARRARPVNSRTMQSHAPVQAIQELLQKHSELRR